MGCRSWWRRVVELLLLLVALKVADSLLDIPYCYWNECCRKPWVSFNSTLFKETLLTRLCGQQPAKNMIYQAFLSHWTSSPSKPLVMSFHGGPGIGKSHTLKLIRDTIFLEKEKTTYFEYIAVPHEYPHQSDLSRLSTYRQHLHKRITNAVSRCEHALIVLEEAHLMSVQLLESIRPFLDTNEMVDGVDFRKATFIFISNTGYQGLEDLAELYYRKGLNVHDIPVVEIEKVLESVALGDEKGGFYKNILLARHLIDFYIPFFPLTRDHVRCCIREEMKRRFHHSPTESQVETILKLMTFFPFDNPIFSEKGCKKVNRAIAMSYIPPPHHQDL